jgi:hypothetical protein
MTLLNFNEKESVKFLVVWTELSVETYVEGTLSQDFRPLVFSLNILQWTLDQRVDS